MRKSAITCRGVLYAPRCPEPHVDPSSVSEARTKFPFRRLSSACRRDSGSCERASRAKSDRQSEASSLTRYGGVGVGAGMDCSPRDLPPTSNACAFCIFDRGVYSMLLGPSHIRKLGRSIRGAERRVPPGAKAGITQSDSRYNILQCASTV